MVEVGIGAHDGGRFTAQLQRCRHQFFGGQALNAHADRRAAGKCNALDQRVAHQRIAHHRAFARQHTHDAIGYTRLLRNAGQLDRHAWCDLGRFDDDGTTCSQSRGHFLSLTGNGRVPRRDGSHHAQRLVHAHCEKVPTRGRDRILPGLGRSGKVLERPRSTGHQGAAFLDGLAVVEALHLRQSFRLFADPVSDPVQHACSLMGHEASPRGLQAGLLGRLNGLVHIAHCGCMQLRHSRAIVRVFGLIGRPRGITPAARKQGLDLFSHQGGLRVRWSSWPCGCAKNALLTRQ